MTEQTRPVMGSDNAYSSSVSVSVLVVIAASALGGLLAVFAAPLVSPNLTATLLGASPKAYWYLSRGTAFVALGLLWLSMVFGLLISDRIAKNLVNVGVSMQLHHRSRGGVVAGRVAEQARQTPTASSTWEPSVKPSAPARAVSA